MNSPTAWLRRSGGFRGEPLRFLVRQPLRGKPRSLSINPHEHVQNYNIFHSFWKRYHILWIRLA